MVERIRVDDVGELRENLNYAECRQIARRKQQRAFAPQPACDVLFEQPMLAMATAQQTRSAGTNAFYMAHGFDHSRIVRAHDSPKKLLIRCSSASLKALRLDL